MPRYLGFSTYNRIRKFSVNDFELVKQDLFNHFHIRKGEKLMNPNFGTIIWDMLYEPYTEAVRQAITEDIRRVVSYDPRIAAENIKISEFTNGISIELTVRYNITNQQTRMVVQFDRQSATLSAGS